VKRLREGVIDLVVATDVAARGLDIENLELVVNFDVPTSPDSYTHRIGRVGRAGREGVAISLVDPRESRLLKLFERHTKGRIDVARVPTIEDLRARRLELTRAALAEAIAAGGLERYRACVDALAKDHDLMDVALAAVKLAHEAAGGDREEDDGEEVQDFGGYEREERPRWQEREDRGGRPTRGGRTTRADRAARDDRGAPAERPAREERPPARKERGFAQGGATARVYVGAGRDVGTRPQDLVGAIANEAGIEGHRIGAIEIQDKYSVVELPEELIDKVVKAMAKSTVKGKKASVRRFVEN